MKSMILCTLTLYTCIVYIFTHKNRLFLSEARALARPFSELQSDRLDIDSGGGDLTSLLPGIYQEVSPTNTAILYLDKLRF